MSFEVAREIALVTYSVFMVLLYAFREPFIVYPTVAMTFTVVWEAVRWNGTGSVVTILVVATLIAVAVVFRKLTQRTVAKYESDEPKRALLLMVGGLTLSLFGIAFPLYIFS